MRSAPVQKWIATIVSAKGVREEEIERSGLLQFLDGLDVGHKVTKEQLLDIVEEGLSACQFTIKTERSITYRPALQSAAFTRETILKKVLDTFSDGEIVSCHKLVSFNYKIVKLKFTGMFGSGQSLAHVTL
jgi:predicted nucleic-acid-binding protein